MNCVSFYDKKNSEQLNNDFIDKVHVVVTHQKSPSPRSGHRTFVTQDYLYLIGGYNPNVNQSSTFTDIWRFNLATEKWQEGFMRNGSMPDCLASFSLSQTNVEKEAYIFGGTGVPFGMRASNQLFKVMIEKCGSISLESQEIEIDELNMLPKMYGHAMCYVTKCNMYENTFKEIIYLVGGTTGHVYNMDVWKLEAVRNKKNIWKCTCLTENSVETEEGRYRLEVIAHNDYLITFGGGSPVFCADFDELLSFNLKKEKYERLVTIGDFKHGFPESRKCHGIVQFENYVYIIGGCRDILSNDDNDVPGMTRKIMGDIWFLNLNTFVWKKMQTKLIVPVFFHSCSVTQDGCIYIFGGCLDTVLNNRTNILQKLWLRPPSLCYIATQAVLNSAIHLRNVEKTECSANCVNKRSRDIVLSQPNNIVLAVLMNCK